MTKLPETIIVNGKEIKYDIDAFVKQYEDRKTLPSIKIVCTRSGKLITMFGTNLHKRVEKYGDIRTLLTTFVCKEEANKDTAAARETAKVEKEEAKAKTAEEKAEVKAEKEAQKQADKEAAAQKRAEAKAAREAAKKEAQELVEA